jgi:superfamily II DNA or RNA helicase
MLKSSSCIVKSPTGSGKSLIIAYVINNLLNWGLIRSSIIVVPTKGLIKQFHSDLLDYGIDDSLIGEVHSTSKEFDKSIVISTWQSLSNKIGAINAFDCVIIDECHGSKAEKLFGILKYADNVTFKYGVTGTLPEDKLELMQVKSYLGPVLKEITNNYIAEKGHISKCNIKMINLHYNNLVIQRNTEYADIRDMVFKHPFRINFISEIASKCTKTLLILVEKIEDEGDYLYNHLQSLGIDKEIVFLHGKTDSNLIEKYRKQAEYDNNLIIIATYGIFSQGINIKSLQYIIKAVSYRSKIRVLQSIGRALRSHIDKEDGAYIFDICDDVKVFKKQKSQRKRFYKNEEFNIEEYHIKENEITNFSDFFDKNILPDELFEL